MTSPKDVKPFEFELEEPVSEAPVPAPANNPHSAESRKAAGRIVHDDRGNAIWKWGGDTSASGTTSGVLKHIDPNDLKVEGQATGSHRASGKPARGVDSGGGYDPYNQGDPKSRAAAAKQGNHKKR